MTQTDYNKIQAIINKLKSTETRDNKVLQEVIKELELYLEDAASGVIKACAEYSFTPNL
jgi:hypothetical protein